MPASQRRCTVSPKNCDNRSMKKLYINQAFLHIIENKKDRKLQKKINLMQFFILSIIFIIFYLNAYLVI